jgi:hypothetical protein
MAGIPKLVAAPHMTRGRLIAVLGAFCVAATARRSPALSAPLEEHGMSSLADIQHPAALRARTHSVDVFRISADIATRTAIKPDRIETFSEVEKHHIADAKQLDELFAALAASNPEPATQPVEYRWKVVAYDTKGARIAEIYASAINPFGMYGEDTLFTFGNGALTAWLNAHVGAFR